MLNKFCKMPLWECNRTLIRVAQGQEPAELVIRHARLISVTTHEILEDTDIAIACGRVAYVGIAPYTAEHCIGEKTRVIDAQGSLVAPGFMDGHIHVESSMVGVDEYARAVVPHGTTGIYWDPHELCNVTGLEGVAEVAKVAAKVPLKAMITTPSCVPAVPGFEDTGASVDAAGVEETMSWDGVVALGEMMNYPGILSCQDNAIEEVNATLKAGCTATGHYSVCETDRGLNAYIASGVSSCHESIRAEDVLAKLRLGMYAQIREGSAWQNLHDLAPAVTDGKIDTRLCNLVSDDNHPNTLTHNQLSDLLIDGEVVAEDGKALFEAGGYVYPSWMTDTMHVSVKIDENTFHIPAVDADGKALSGDFATVRSMVVAPGSTITGSTEAQAPIVDGCLTADPSQDLLKTFVFERHHDTGTYAYGFVKGFGIHGALAQTVAHDAHNLLVVGDNDADMALAAKTLVECGGGEVAVQDGKILGLVKLPICGLMSPEHVEKVAADVDNIEAAWENMGCTMPSPFMTMGLLSLACIPSLRLTNRGYVDTDTFQFVPLVIDSEA